MACWRPFLGRNGIISRRLGLVINVLRVSWKGLYNCNGNIDVGKNFLQLSVDVNLEQFAKLVQKIGEDLIKVCRDCTF